MTTNSKEYMKNYMKQYTRNNSMPVHCALCDINTKKYLWRSHEKTKKHIQITLKLEQNKSLIHTSS